MKTIDGLILRTAFLNGEDCLNKNKEIVNSLNVFPVPDGDTGTNMHLTMSSAIKKIKSVKEIDVAIISKAASDGALMGARGNSGVILSQLLRGFANSLKDKKVIGIEDLKDAFISAYKLAYKAVMKPTEGTILTVARFMGEFAEKHYKEYEDIKEFTIDILKEGRRALDKTPDMLPVLKEAGVVDSGGRGLLFILEGALEQKVKYVEAEKEFSIVSDAIVTSHAQLKDEDIKYGYCTEFMIITNDYDYVKFREAIEPYGDSIIVVQGDDLIKTHIHTNNPGMILEMAMKIGPLKDMKIENMRLQHSHLLVKDEEVRASQKDKSDAGNKELKKYGFVAISSGEGMDELFKQFGVDELISGGQTMNPSTEDMINSINKINAENIFLFPNNGNIILAAEQAREISDKNVIVIKTKSVPESFSSLVVFDENLSCDENEINMINAFKENKVAQVTFSVRDTTMNGKTIKKGDYIGIENGEIKVSGKDLNKACIELLKKMTDEEDSIITVYYGKEVDEKSAKDMISKIEKEYEDFDVVLQYGGQPIYYYLFSVE